MMRSILSVVAGSAVWTTLWLSGNAIIRSLFPARFREDLTTDSGGILLVILILSVVFSVVAGWVTARVAARREIAHGTALGALQLAIGIFVQSTVWDAMPIWYHLPFLALIVPGNVAGAWWRKSRTVPRVHSPS